ncbi:MAG: TlpA family protein disulfide reductase [Nitrospirota bacterium]|nr:TlpA family protein disulfide reductase [Nitrospirota bacterium]
MRRRAPLIVSALVVAGLSVMFWAGRAAEATGSAAASAAPPFDLVTLAGEAYSKESLKGRPALLVFWAPWCPVCRKELPILGRFYEQEKPAQLRVIAIGFADKRGNVEAYVKAHPETFVFPTAFDEDNWISQAFKVTATPTFVLLDSQGNIQLVHRGGGINQNPKYREFLAGLNN